MPGVTVRVVVVGDEKTGKTSLIAAYVHKEFQRHVVSVSHVVQSIPSKQLPDVFLEIHDTSSLSQYGFENSSHGMQPADDRHIDAAAREISCADVVIACYDVSRPETLQGLENRWLPLIKSNNPYAPIIVVGNKVDKEGDAVGSHAVRQPDPVHDAWKARMQAILRRFKKVDTTLKCTAKNRLLVLSVWKVACEAFLFPIYPLYDVKHRRFRAQFHAALRRIFYLLDCDQDGFMSDAEWEEWERYCLGSVCLLDINATVKSRPTCYTEGKGLTLLGFSAVHCLMFKSKSLRTLWKCFHAFGYVAKNDRLEISEHTLYPRLRVPPGGMCTLSARGNMFVQRLFERFSTRRVGEEPLLTFETIRTVFDSTGVDPESVGPYFRQTKQTNAGGLRGVDCGAFEALWNFFALSNYRICMAQLALLGYQYSDRRADSKLIDALSIYPSPRECRAAGNTSGRIIYRCALVGAGDVGKSTLLRRFIQHPPESESSHRFDVPLEVVGEVNHRYLVVQAFTPDEAMLAVTSDGEAIAGKDYDLICLVYDGSNRSSLDFVKRYYTKLRQAGSMESAYRSVPCMVIANKTDMVLATQDVAEEAQRFCKDAGLLEPYSISAKTNSNAELYELWKLMLSYSQYPYVPERHMHLNSASRRRGWTRWLVSASVLAAGIAVAVGAWGKWDLSSFMEWVSNLFRQPRAITNE